MDYRGIKVIFQHLWITAELRIVFAKVAVFTFNIEYSQYSVAWVFAVNPECAVSCSGSSGSTTVGIFVGG